MSRTAMTMKMAVSSSSGGVSPLLHCTGLFNPTMALLGSAEMCGFSCFQSGHRWGRGVGGAGLRLAASSFEEQSASVRLEAALAFPFCLTLN